MVQAVIAIWLWLLLQGDLTVVSTKWILFPGHTCPLWLAPGFSFLFFSQHEIPGEILIIPGPLCDSLIVQSEEHKSDFKISSFLPGWLQYRIKREWVLSFKIRGMEKKGLDQKEIFWLDILWRIRETSWNVNLPRFTNYKTVKLRDHERVVWWLALPSCYNLELPGTILSEAFSNWV